ncbi:MAG: hypothetical protein ITG02_14800 [Patulibacter sp.]|nr:hypothetical protein [Patulibacter sp.]
MTTEPPEERDDDGLPPLADHLRNHPDRPGEGRKARSQNRLLLMTLFAVIPLLVVFAVVLGSLASGPPSTDPEPGGGSSSGLAQVTRYCNYVAQTEEAFQPCLDENRDRAFLDEDTNPARYAKGELTECGPDAGPRCTARQGVRPE